MNRRLVRMIESTESTNKFIYFLRKIPFIGKRINPYIYLNTTFKKFVSIISFIKKFLNILIRKIVYVGIIYFALSFIPDTFYSKFSYLNHINLFIWTMITLNLLRSILDITIFEDMPLKWLLVTSFRRSYDDYFRFRFFNKIVEKVYFCLLIFGLIAFTSDLRRAFFTFIFLFFQILFFEYLNILYIEKNKKRLGFKLGFLIFIFYNFGLLFFIFTPLLLSKLLWTITLLLLCMSAYLVFKILQYPHFDTIGIYATSTIKMSNDAINRNQQLMNQGLRVDEKYIELNRSKEIARKHKAYPFLNRIFLLRHQNLWLKPLKFKLMALFGVGTIFTLFLLVFEKDSQFFTQGYLDNVASLFILFYFLSTGESLCKAYFMNCDYSLMHYPFYTRRETILNQFMSRFFTIAILNLILLASYFIFLILWVALGFTEFNFIALIPYTLTLILVSLFFSIHNIFLYYIFQPFDRDLNIKSVPYTIASTGFYLLAFYLDDFIKYIPRTNLFITVFISIYMAIALFVVWKYSHKTFRVK